KVLHDAASDFGRVAYADIDLDGVVVATTTADTASTLDGRGEEVDALGVERDDGLGASLTDDARHTARPGDAAFSEELPRAVLDRDGRLTLLRPLDGLDGE